MSVTMQLQELYAPKEYWSLSLEVKREISNGCGAGSALFDFVPDDILGLDISECCNIHDYMYHVGETNEDKLEADRVFLNNTIRVIDKNTSWKWLRKRRKNIAYMYYKAVSKFGGPAFWDGKNDGDSLKRCL